MPSNVSYLRTGGGEGGDKPFPRIGARPEGQVTANAAAPAWGRAPAEIQDAMDGVIEIYRSLRLDVIQQAPNARKGRGVKMATEREVTDAKLQTVEARVEARLVGIEGKLDRLLDRVEASVEAAKEAKAEASLAKTAAGNTKWNILFTGLAVAGLVYTLFQVYTASIDNMTGLISTLTGASQMPQSQTDTATKTPQ